MTTGVDRRLLVVWIGLSAVTLAQLSVGSASASPSAAIGATAIGVALVKVRLILREFMEVRHAPVWLGRVTDLWLAVTAVVLLGAWVAGRAFAVGG